MPGGLGKSVVPVAILAMLLANVQMENIFCNSEFQKYRELKFEFEVKLPDNCWDSDSDDTILYVKRIYFNVSTDTKYNMKAYTKSNAKLCQSVRLTKGDAYSFTY